MYDDLVKRLREAAIRADSGNEISESLYLDILQAADAIEELQSDNPATNVVERKKGMWREDMWLTTKGYSCSECNCFTINSSMFCPD